MRSALRKEHGGLGVRGALRVPAGAGRRVEARRGRRPGRPGASDETQCVLVRGGQVQSGHRGHFIRGSACRPEPQEGKEGREPETEPVTSAIGGSSQRKEFPPDEKLRSYALEGETGSRRLGDPTGLPASLGAGPCGPVLMHYHVGPPRLLQHGSDVRVPRFLFTRQHLLVFF